VPDPDLAALYRVLHGEDEADALEAARALAGGGEVVAVSACLAGVACRFDGRDRRSDLPAAVGRRLLPVCPEVLAGLGVPRPPLRFDAAGRIVAEDGTDVTAAMTRGAERAAALVRAAGASLALLKERSPSCGLRQVHGPDGVQPGAGVFAAKLVAAGLDCVTEEELEARGD
jgi:uncharacterized protein YbbK (DUF523 family)